MPEQPLSDESGMKWINFSTQSDDGSEKQSEAA
jgi:hypothetical protein